jgi:hypothetical protein
MHSAGRGHMCGRNAVVAAVQAQIHHTIGRGEGERFLYLREGEGVRRRRAAA